MILHFNTRLDLLLQKQDYFSSLFCSCKNQQLKTLNLRVKSLCSRAEQLNAQPKQKLQAQLTH